MTKCNAIKQVILPHITVEIVCHPVLLSHCSYGNLALWLPCLSQVIVIYNEWNIDKNNLKEDLTLAFIPLQGETVFSIMKHKESK